MDQKLNFGHVKFAMPIRYTSGDVNKEVGYMMQIKSRKGSCRRCKFESSVYSLYLKP